MSAHPLHHLGDNVWDRLSNEFRGAAPRERPTEDRTRKPLRLVHEEADEPSAVFANLPALLRHASDAIKSAEARALAIQEQMAEAIAIAEERARAAEDRAHAAESLAHALEKRAVEAIRAAEKRAQAAEECLERVRDAVSRPR
jgi:hypothetical protein